MFAVYASLVWSVRAVHWPIYGSLWRDFDSHTLRYLWLARVLAPVGVALFGGMSIFLIAKTLAAH
jgi:hypothetical protein